jgi:hypothetical protein
MIEFRCNNCGRVFREERSNAGKKGKCPNCQSIITVPYHSDNKIIFDQNELTCKEPNLQKLYDAIVSKMGEKIKKHTIRDREKLFFEIETNEIGTRSQIVLVTCIKGSETDSEGMFFILSEVGTISDPDSGILALRFAEAYPFVNIALSENNILSVRMCADLKMSPERLWPHILGVAITADKLEEMILGCDLK